MQWLIDIALEAMEQWIYDNGIFRDRGDPVAVDYDTGFWIKDGNWHDLDLSAIVGENAKGVLLRINIASFAVDEAVSFRKAGNVSERNIAQAITEVAGLEKNNDVVTPCAANRHIEYNVDVGAWVLIRMTVKGWWL